MTDGARRLEAPHRRVQSGSRIFERAVTLGYRAVSWFITRLPPAIPIAIIARGAQLSYFVWPTKRRWSNANFGHVLALPPSDGRVRRTALTAYAAYARYVVELIRLPTLTPAEAGRLTPTADMDGMHELWQTSGRGLIFSVGHLGNPEAVAAGIASREIGRASCRERV